MVARLLPPTERTRTVGQNVTGANPGYDLSLALNFENKENFICDREFTSSMVGSHSEMPESSAARPIVGRSRNPKQKAKVKDQVASSVFQQLSQTHDVTGMHFNYFLNLDLAVCGVSLCCPPIFATPFEHGESGTCGVESEKARRV